VARRGAARARRGRLPLGVWRVVWSPPARARERCEDLHARRKCRNQQHCPKHVAHETRHRAPDVRVRLCRDEPERGGREHGGDEHDPEGDARDALGAFERIGTRAIPPQRARMLARLPSVPRPLVLWLAGPRGLMRATLGEPAAACAVYRRRTLTHRVQEQSTATCGYGGAH
jgi:hypothetical protein